MSLSDLFDDPVPLPAHRLSASDRERVERLLRTGDVLLLPAGERIADRFVLAELVGIGAFGLVYLARDTRVDADVALKLLHPGVDPGEQLRFEAEARLLAGLRHRHVVTVLDAGQHEGQPFIAMEFLPVTLRARLQQGLAPREGLALWEQVADAVAFLHERGVVHRDLKPGNVLLRDVGGGRFEARVADFGLAAPLGADQVRGGTLVHMAPEQAEQPAPATSHDVWALGVLLVEVLTGRHPWAGTEAEQKLSRLSDRRSLPSSYRAILMEHPPAPLPRLEVVGADALGDVVSRALAVDAAQRYPSVAALREDVRRAQVRLPLLGVPEPLARRIRGWLLRHRGPVAGGVAVALVAGGWTASTLRPGFVVPELTAPIAGYVARIDGVEVTIEELAALPVGPGVVTVELSAPLHDAVERTLDVPAGGSVSFAADLIRTTGRARITTTPPGATLRLSSGTQALPAFVAPLDGDVPTGRWSIEASAPGRLSVQRRGSVREDGLRAHVWLAPALGPRVPVGSEPVLGSGVLAGEAVLLVGHTSGVTIRDGWTGALREEIPTDAVTAPPLLADLDGDGAVDLLLGTARPALEVRAGPDFARVLWREDVGRPHHGDPRFGVTAEPTIADGMVLFGGGDGLLRARDQATGAPVWTVPIGPGDPAREIDARVSVAGDVVVAASMSGVLSARALQTGAGLWSRRFPADLRADPRIVETTPGELAVLAVDVAGNRAIVPVTDPPTDLAFVAGAAVEPRDDLPVWFDQRSWRRLNTEGPDGVRIEDLRSGALGAPLPGPTGGVAWARVVGDLAVWSRGGVTQAARIRGMTLTPIARGPDRVLHPPALFTAGDRPFAWLVDGDEAVRFDLGARSVWERTDGCEQVRPRAVADQDGDGARDLAVCLSTTPPSHVVLGSRHGTVRGPAEPTRIDAGLPGVPEWRAEPTVVGAWKAIAMSGKPGGHPGVVLLDADATPIWTHRTDDHVFSAPLLLGAADGLEEGLLVVQRSGRVQRIRVADAGVDWQIDLGDKTLPGAALLGESIVVPTESALVRLTATGVENGRIAGRPDQPGDFGPRTWDGGVYSVLDQRRLVLWGTDGLRELAFDEDVVAASIGSALRIFGRSGRVWSFDRALRRLADDDAWHHQGATALQLGEGLELRWRRGRIAVVRVEPAPTVRPARDPRNAALGGSPLGSDTLSPPRGGRPAP